MHTPPALPAVAPTLKSRVRQCPCSTWVAWHLEQRREEPTPCTTPAASPRSPPQSLRPAGCLKHFQAPCSSSLHSRQSPSSVCTTDSTNGITAEPHGAANREGCNLHRRADGAPCASPPLLYLRPAYHPAVPHHPLHAVLLAPMPGSSWAAW